jgi:1,4-dihydroxy-6-naphthoate synthase
VLATQNRDSGTGGGTRLTPVLIRVGHSADPDDAFMAWGLVSKRVDPRGFEFEFVPQDIQVLNEWALERRLEVTALSLATYPLVQDHYALLPHGASIGSGYGPIVVARGTLSLKDLRALEIVVPGRLTTAFLVLGMALGRGFAHRTLPFDQILDEVKSGAADAGLLIHEGQLTYADEGLVKEATRYALGFARELDSATADRFIDLYVNELTVDYGDEGRQAVEELLRRAEATGAYERPVRVEFVGS